MLELRNVHSHPLVGINATFGPGLHVVIGRPEDGLREFAELAAGYQTTSRGSVRLFGQDPYRTASARRGVGCVLPTEPQLPAQALRRIVEHRLPPAAATSAEELLSACALADRPASSLSPAELRSVAFLLATSAQRKLLVVYEPFTSLPGIHSHAVSARLRAQVEGGAVLLALTSNLAHSQQLGGSSCLLDRGQLSALAHESARQLPRHPVALVVSCPAAAELASAMLQHASFGVSFDPAQPEQLIVTSTQPDHACLQVLEIAERCGLQVAGLTRIEPTVDQLRAAAAGRAHAAFQRAAQANATPGPANASASHRQGSVG